MSIAADHDDNLRQYYSRLFPYDSFCRWLGAGHVDKTLLSRREFSFTLRDDIYLRYLTFSSSDELRAEMLRRLPHKIDIGAVFNARAVDHNKIRDFQPQEKEIVFDIDMTDYDDVRTCCSGAAICTKCWHFMTLAVKILDRALREDFGFRHLLWVYSGRRGIHCWVSDPQARRLGQSARSAVAEYLQLLTGGDSQAKKVLLGKQPVHPSVERALEVIKPSFAKMCLEEQDILGTPERWNKVLALIPHEELRREIGEEFPKLSNSVKRWNLMRDRLAAHLHAANNRTKVSQYILDEIMLQFAYPRLDINVSKGLNHLLKAPFCVHPKTGRVCVPLDPARVEQFTPETVPTITQLTDEIDKFAKEEGATKVVSKDYKKTSLREPMKIFDEFLAKLSETWKGKLIEQSDAMMEF